MRTLGALAVALAVAVSASCADDTSPLALPSSSPVASGSGSFADFLILGATYGAEGDEMNDSPCSGTFALSRDSSNWAIQPPALWVRGLKYDRVGCVIGTGGGYDFYVGGNLSIHAEGNGYFQGVNIHADQMATGELLNVPTSGTTIYLSASPWEWQGFRFHYWEVRRNDDTVYRVCTPTFERPGNIDEYQYFAIFRQCVTHWSDQSKCTNDPSIGTTKPCEWF